METQSGAKIAIRGKGSVKEGKGKSDAAHSSNLDEDLHCLIMADTEDKVNKAKELIHNVIETVSWRNDVAPLRNNTDPPQAASIPEGQNELKRNQLRELAALNGTLRDDENQACQNCGEIGHRKYDCPQQRNFTATIICRVCGNAGHMARDCPDRARGADFRNLPPRRGPENALDNDYENMMKAITGGADSTANTSRQIGWDEGVAPQGDANAGAPPRGPAQAPWLKGPSGNSAPWQQRPEPTGAAAPWQRRDNNNYQGNQGGYNSGYNSGPPAAPWAGGNAGGGMAPWQQPQQQQPSYGGYGAPPGGMPYEAPPPPPPSYDAPPPPPSDIPPPPPPN
jgi:splicing factor 1